MIFELNEELVFPDPHLGEDSGLLAIGGDLSTDRLLLAYAHGIFPWFPFKQDLIEWWCPMQRFVIFPDEIHVSHSMRTLLNKQLFKVTFNKAFEQVIQHCSQGTECRQDQEGAWLGPNMMKAYTELHRRGFAMSVEVWQDGQLVGGLYGVTVYRMFCGESMFSLVPSGSKVALISLCHFLQQQEDKLLIDCQFETDHLRSMGGRHISYDEYMEYLS